MQELGSAGEKLPCLPASRLPSYEVTMIENLKEERYVLSLLKYIFLREPSKKLLQELGEIKIVREENDIDRGLNLIAHSVMMNKARLDEYTEDIAIEFARLFIGPKDPPAIPYASFYLSESKTLMTDVTTDVRKRYLEAGMAVKDLYSIPDDHIGIELEFIYYLTEKIIDLYEKGERSEASRLFEIREDFFKEHLSLWAPLFANNILASTNDDFYRGVALLLNGFFSMH